ncbi:hypothetical protein ABZ883_04905 [Streptomyces sp. NPDC046977]|uniref:hypothetical protein n=1 Tax=Streptomyces sp. NPDC046977 TaxID=3154703 RepID=UPI0033E92AD0
MTDEVSRFHNITALSLYIDTHIIDAPDEAAVFLRRLMKEGWISLSRTDVMGTELARAPDEKRADLAEASASYPESYGPMVWNQSRWGSSVWGSEEDHSRLNDTFAILFPNVNRATARGNHLRDVMHVSTAIRYGGFGFVTRERRLLNKAEQIAERFHSFQILSPEQANSEAMARVRGVRELHRLEPHRGSLPSWPVESDVPSGSAETTQ